MLLESLPKIWTHQGLWGCAKGQRGIVGEGQDTRDCRHDMAGVWVTGLD